jgi:predicted permease
MVWLLVQDLQYAARCLCKSRLLTFVAIILLCLGIGLNAVIFSVVDAVILEPLQYPDAGRLIILHWQQKKEPARGDVSARAYFKVKQQAHSLEHVAAVYPSRIGVNLSSGPSTAYARALPVSEDFFAALSVAPVLGRDLEPEGWESGRQGGAILSYDLWTKEMGASPNVLGQEIRINGTAYKVAGVMPAGFHSFPQADIWLSLQLTPHTANLGNDYRVIARIRDGYTIDQVRQDLKSISQREQLTMLPAGSPSVLSCERLKDYVAADAKPAATVLFVAAVFVLLVACLNVAMLVTVHSVTRTQEVGIRIALGAPRARIARLFFLESFLLALLGGVSGAILAKESLRFMDYIVPRVLHTASPLQINLRVLLFTALISTLAALISGSGPTMKIWRANVNELLKTTSGALMPSPGRARTGRLLVATQAALSTVLLSGSFLLLGNLLHLQAVPPGFEPDHVVVAQVLLGAEKRSREISAAGVLDHVFTQIREVPFVESVSSTTTLPLERGLNLPVRSGDDAKKIEHAAEYQIVSPEYFRCMRIPIRAGRDFSHADEATSLPVTIINETLANKWWPGGGAVGQSLDISAEAGQQLSDRPRKIVGVVRDIHATGLDRPAAPTVFVPAKQAPDGILAFVNGLFLTSIVVRTVPEGDASGNFHSALAGLDKELAVASVRPLYQVVASSLEQPRFNARLSLLFSFLALLLTAVGVHGVLTHHSEIRARELTLRMVLGANRWQVVYLLMMQGLKPVLGGTAIGVVCALFLRGVVASVLYNPAQPSAAPIFGSAVVLNTVAGLACSLSSLRAASSEPGGVLKCE